MTVGIVYKPLDQTRFLEILSDSLNSPSMLSEEWHMLGDLNVNLYQNGSILVNQAFFISSLGFCLELRMLNSETEIGTGVA